MDCTITSLPYPQTGFTTKIIEDYLKEAPSLRPFFTHPVSVEGLIQSIECRKAFNTNRKLLVEVLRDDYAAINISEKVKQNIESLSEENTFTIVTAHQPNIFTGYLYFIYKILHIIKLADHLNHHLAHYKFVPVYYMGSEDADLDELGNININDEKIVWQTSQKGAVGRMSTEGLQEVITRLEGELIVHPFGEELISLLKDCYVNSPNIRTATFRLVNHLFENYGLIILMPDNAKFKQGMYRVFEDDLLHQTPSGIVEETIERLSQHYPVQANPREINLFYLKDDIRGRIVQLKNEWKVVGEKISFSESALKDELRQHPERFSPNVILRGLYQENILPNIAFIGGGGETAYWLEFNELFAHYHVPFPVLILRNSFLFVEKSHVQKIERLAFTVPDFFQEEHRLLTEFVKRTSGMRLDVKEEVNQLAEIYLNIKDIAGKADPGLLKHVEALQTLAVNRLNELEKKMLKAEKRKFNDQQRQIKSIKNKLFPQNNLQERVDNFMPYYAKYGKDFINTIYEHSPTLEQEFVILEEK